MKKFKFGKLFFVFFTSLITNYLQAQEHKWVFGNSQLNSSGTFLPLKIGNLQFMEMTTGVTPIFKMRNIGESIRNIKSMGTQDVNIKI